MGQDAAEILQEFARFGVDLGLDRMQKLLRDLGNPHEWVPVVHVAGTNGKGSVCAYLSSVLTAAGYRVGRYTSPHLVKWHERICVNQQAIDDATLKARLDQVIAAIDPQASTPTQFEVITAVAWLHFAQAQVDIAVMEVGLGGRLDATNVCDRPLVSVITPIGRDHWQRLGDSLAAIAGEKAGILKQRCPAVIAPQPSAAQAVLAAKATEHHCPTVWVQPAILAENGQWTTQIDGFPLSYSSGLLGDHQRVNSAVAIAAVQSLRQQGWRIADKAIQSGMAATQWPGRLQWITWPSPSDSPPTPSLKLLLDGAHNGPAATVLRSYVDHHLDHRLDHHLEHRLDDHRLDQESKGSRALQPGINRPTVNPVELGPQSTIHPTVSQPHSHHHAPRVTWIMGMLDTKDHPDILRALLRPGDRLHLVPVPGHLSASPQAIAQIAQSICPQLDHCQCHGDISTALTQVARESLTRSPMEALTVLCGSLYLVGDFLANFPEL